MQRILWLIIAILGIISCKNEKNLSKPDAKMIIDKAILSSGVAAIASSEIEFDFRDIHYKAKRNKGVYELSRIIKRNDSVISDLLGNNGFSRIVNNNLVDLSESEATKFSNSVNSVHYFSVLPYSLDDKAVNYRYIDTSLIKNELYYMIEITFDKVGGGEDFNDVFLYWVHSKSYKIDYLAYKYFTDGGGIRFREAYNERYINGIRFVDYKNYKPKVKSTELHKLHVLFETGNLDLLSLIELKNIKVDLIND
uniref:DUF6503 family protein n=1 Tax=Gelidibacter sp. TaxID=2018083 RepID=UPI0040499B5E